MKIKLPKNTLSLCLAFVLGTISVNVLAESYSGGQPISPQPDSASLKPGLSVNYFFEYYGHIDEVSRLTGGVEGEPLENIAHRTDTGDVLTADRPMGVGAQIRGMIHLAETGIYIFKIESNDGIRAHVGGIKIWTDPEIHGNRWSRPLEYEVTEAGWYELHIDYYQRKGTSALQFAWTPPGATEQEIVPPEAFAH
ncbi:MAG: PA14 domain-containing protein [bacterium]